MNWGYEVATVGITVYDDRIEIENAGRFPVRILPDVLMHEEEDNRKNTSMPPNPVIANVMYLAGLIEHWGRGLSMMARQCEGAGLPAPEFYCDGTVVKITFMRPKNTVDVSSSACNNTSNSTSNSTSDSASRGSAAASLTIEGMTIKMSLLKLIEIIGEDWISLYDMLEIMRFKSRFSFTKTYLKPAISAGLVALENPDSPNAPNQRYGLTLKGKALYYERHTNENDVQNDTQRIQIDPQNDLQINLESQPDPLNEELDPQKTAIIKAIKENNEISRSELANIAGCSESTIK